MRVYMTCVIDALRYTPFTEVFCFACAILFGLKSFLSRQYHLQRDYIGANI